MRYAPDGRACVVLSTKGELVAAERWQVLATLSVGLACGSLFSLLQSMPVGFSNTAWRLRRLCLGAVLYAYTATDRLEYRVT